MSGRRLPPARGRQSPGRDAPVWFPGFGLPGVSRCGSDGGREPGGSALTCWARARLTGKVPGTAHPSGLCSRFTVSASGCAILNLHSSGVDFQLWRRLREKQHSPPRSKATTSTYTVSSETWKERRPPPQGWASGGRSRTRCSRPGGEPTRFARRESGQQAECLLAGTGGHSAPSTAPGALCPWGRGVASL